MSGDRIPARGSRDRRAVVRIGLLAAVCIASLLSSSPAAGSQTQSGVAAPNLPGAATTPVLAYYYIWFDATSWNRAKSDLPLTGKYSSDERSVMVEHVRTARNAGIDGFIVSWKHSEKLDRRLEVLAEIAAAEDFALVIIYQGLDFEREPLPVPRITADLDFFLESYATHPAFQFFGKPTVILSGSWKFSRSEVEEIGNGRRDRLLLLASEKDVDGIERLDGVIDGDAYYWSSVDPVTQGKYQERLDSMSRSVHDRGGIWIAPAAPGFDARLVGGTSVIERDDGVTLALQLAAALASAPDAVGLISWNEFSENTHVEPSRRYGTIYIEKVAELLGGSAPAESISAGDPFDSSEPGNRGSGFHQFAALGFVGVVIFAGWAMATLRRRRLPEGAL